MVRCYDICMAKSMGMSVVKLEKMIIENLAIATSDCFHSSSDCAHRSRNLVYW